METTALDECRDTIPGGAAAAIAPRAAQGP